MSILRQVPSKTKMQREMKKILFGDHLFCPRCGNRRVKKYQERYHCQKCRKPFSLTSATWLKGMKISLDIFWLLLWCWSNEVAPDQAQKLCGVSKPTQRRWYEKFREHIPRQPFEQVRLSGIVQMDEAYRGGTQGYAIVGAKEKQGKQNKRRKMAFQVVPRPAVNRGEALSLLTEHVVPDSHLHTDGAAIYRSIEKWWRVNHRSEIHSKWEFALTSEIEGLWGTLTTFTRRMYHHVTKEKIEELLREFQARQMYPEWFDNPSSFLTVSLQRIPRKTMRKSKVVFPQQIPLQTPLISVPY
jgi:transposase-like protein